MSTENAHGLQRHLSQLVGDIGEIAGEINVKINFDIIKLFSEGLYQSPHKGDYIANLTIANDGSVIRPKQLF